MGSDLTRTPAGGYRHPRSPGVSLTARQRQVLELIARGHTNGEIGRILGISLDGAKYHVSEILAKLGVETREEAGDWWRDYQRPAARLARARRMLVAPAALKLTAGALGVVALIGLVIAGAVTFANRDGLSDPGVPEETSSIPPVSPTSATDETPPPDPREVQGLVPQVIGRVPDRVITAPTLPDSPFDSSAGPAVIYDTETGETIDLGLGGLGSFSPDGRRYAWVASELTTGTIRVLDLDTREIRDIGQGTFAAFPDDTTVAYNTAANRAFEFDLRTGIEREVEWSEALDAYSGWMAALRDATPDGYRVGLSPERECDAAGIVCRHQVIDAASGNVVLEFEAFRATPAGPGRILVATEPVNFMSNLFLVPIDTGEAEFVATATVAEPNFPFVASERFVAWVEDYCGVDQGDLHIVDLVAGELIRIDNGEDRWGYLSLSPAGLLGIGDFGAAALFDPSGLSYEAVLPADSVSRSLGYAGDTVWSPDYRYAARGIAGGHGGLCGG